MQKANLAAYSPRLFSRLPSPALSHYLLVMQRLMDHAANAAYQQLHQLQQATLHRHWLQRYFKALGFPWVGTPADERRWLEKHGSYLQSRGSVAGLQLLCYLITGHMPQQMQWHYLPPSRCGTFRLQFKQGQRLQAGDPCLQIAMPLVLTATTTSLLIKALRQDLPLQCWIDLLQTKPRQAGLPQRLSQLRLA